MIHERVKRKIMVEYIEINSLISNSQHDFRKGRSTLTQLLSYFDQVYDGLWNNSDTHSMYLNYKNIFDIGYHRLLLLKLSNYKFHSSLINWIRSSLVNRLISWMSPNQGPVKSEVLCLWVLYCAIYYSFCSKVILHWIYHYPKQSYLRMIPKSTTNSKVI